MYDLEEQDQIDALKSWWKQYGNLVTTVSRVSRSPDPRGSAQCGDEGREQRRHEQPRQQVPDRHLPDPQQP